MNVGGDYCYSPPNCYTSVVHHSPHMAFLDWVQEAIGCKVEDEYGMVHVITGGKLVADSPMWPMIQLTDDMGVLRYVTLDRFSELISVG